MRVMLTAFAAAALIAVAADVTLDRVWYDSAERQAAPEAVRLD